MAYAKMVGEPESVFRNEFKEKVVMELFQKLNTGLTYNADRGIPQKDFATAQFFNNRIDEYSSEDCIYGKIRETEIVLSEISTSELRPSRKRKDMVPIFNGLVMAGGLLREFEGIIRILPLQGDQRRSFKRRFQDEILSMEEHPIFDSRFIVATNDRKQARKFMTPEFVGKILELQETWGYKAIRLSFVGKMVFVAIPSRRNLLEPNEKESMFKRDEFERISRDLRACLKLMSKLDELISAGNASVE